MHKCCGSPESDEDARRPAAHFIMLYIMYHVYRIIVLGTVPSLRSIQYVHGRDTVYIPVYRHTKILLHAHSVCTKVLNIGRLPCCTMDYNLFFVHRTHGIPNVYILWILCDNVHANHFSSLILSST